MELVNPGIGLIFWMTLVFAILIIILGKFAWKPIMKALKEREAFIDESLKAADKARDEIKDMEFSNEKLMKEAKQEHDAILKQARKTKDSIIEKAREAANEEADRIVENAKERIENEKKAAMTDLKNELADLAIEIAEMILKDELSDIKKQKKYIDKLIDEAQLN
ncbi:MAG: F0F1 ATP synthase subunit B [Bacteroidales bacterium]